MRIALGVSYNGQAYQGWQSQSSGNTVQDKLEAALGRFAAEKVSTICAGRTDAGVHGLMQVVHFDTELNRAPYSWVRGTNTFLPADIAVQWAQPVPEDFHSRYCATGRRYAYVLMQSPVRPSVEAGRVGWMFYQLDGEAMQKAAQYLVGEHDFSSFRASGCQAKTPVKTLYDIRVTRRMSSGGSREAAASSMRPGDTESMECCYWRVEFDGSAFLHHMVRNIMGCLIAIGQGQHPPEWMKEVLAARSRDAAAPTFSPDGLYFLGPVYDEKWGLPTRTVGFDWLP
ncbi:tRNA pseudouridine(38-40) synthase TruA [Comamonas sp. Y33R10-2]|uniref:tRNA pseudouridine(38-40) synthase TruA n=1 Tax=Comamonas sp. Y33R10-2 TaxID=2853257 RepID=UPI001C5CAA29|nr:tRNA pseudouridine(38-40) synthase TruA [Comamonas sp. Y33R10-2]QXZ10115.1 tRNA pseudouridine(38-40) synthase TruA [Comamonas sp. Y33R10-2]